MSVFEDLRRATVEASETQDLPDPLAARLHHIAEAPEAYRHLEKELRELIAQVELYDTYGQTGYLGMGVNNVILEGTIRRLEGKSRT